MTWQLAGTHDMGVEEGAPPHIFRVRELIRRAIEKANAGEDYLGVDHETGIAVSLRKVGNVPNAVMIGQRVAAVNTKLAEVAASMGVTKFNIVSDYDWIAPLPLKQV
jgi:hypothetical protein